MTVPAGARARLFKDMGARARLSKGMGARACLAKGVDARVRLKEGWAPSLLKTWDLKMWALKM